MDVPRRMRLVLTAAAAKIVSPSGRAPPVVSQAADTAQPLGPLDLGDGVGGGAGDGKANSFLWGHGWWGLRMTCCLFAILPNEVNWGSTPLVDERRSFGNQINGPAEVVVKNATLVFRQAKGAKSA